MNRTGHLRNSTALLRWVPTLCGVMFLLPTPAWTEEVYPRPLGSYHSLAQHPRIFTTPQELKALAQRINIPHSYSARMFAALADRVGGDLKAPRDWDAAYSGRDIDTYLHTFSIESAGGYKNEIRSDSQLRQELHLDPKGPLPPRGAAIVASRLALFAALIKAGAKTPTHAPSSQQAADLAKRILLAWADKGYREKPRGPFISSYTDAQGKPAVVVALQIARGAIYSAEAQDLLEYLGLGVLDRSEIRKMDDFHRGLFDVIRTRSNAEFDQNETSKYSGAMYNNQFTNHLAGMLAIARLLDDGRKFESVLEGRDPTCPVKMPWTLLFNKVIYGQDDSQRLPMFPNSGKDALTSHPSFVSPIASPGEINDRYRNANPDQGFGYCMFTLERLYNSAEILRIAGFDAYKYRGTHHQSLEMATQYYAKYGQCVGMEGTVSAQNASRCPNYQQYLGKHVGGIDCHLMLAALRFPSNPLFQRLDGPAKEHFATRSADRFDAVLFGCWKD